MYGWNVNVTAVTNKVSETSGAYSGSRTPVSHGLMAGTRIASNLGWRAVDKLAVGDKVLTFDNGVQPIVDIRRSILWVDATSVAAGFWPVTVPAGALGNAEDVILLPDQGVMLETDLARDFMGDPFAIVPALALEGLCGIHRSPPKHQMELITLYFAQDEVIYLDGGLLVFCPRSMMQLQDLMAPPEKLNAMMQLIAAQELLFDSDIAEQSLQQTKGYVFGATEMVLVA